MDRTEWAMSTPKERQAAMDGAERALGEFCELGAGGLMEQCYQLGYIKRPSTPLPVTVEYYQKLAADLPSCTEKYISEPVAPQEFGQTLD